MQAQDGDKRREASSSSTNAASGAWTVVIGAAVIAAVTTKVIRSSRRAREAQYEARAWRRAFMTIADRQSSRPYLSSREDCVDKRFAAKPRLYGGLEDGKAGTQQGVSQQKPENTTTNASCPPPRVDQNPPLQVKQQTPAQPSPLPDKTKTRPASSGIQYIIPSSDLQNAYSIVHPHEDWDWTPSDHPPRRTSWRRNRLPPWAIGFTSALRAARNEPPKADTAEEVPTKQSREEDMLRSAIWPASDPLKASEVAFIAEEAFEEIRESKKSSSASSSSSSSTPAEKDESASVTDDTERMQHLERQVWALLERAKALEDRLRSRKYY